MENKTQISGVQEFKGSGVQTTGDGVVSFIDTHSHLDGEEFDADRDEVVERARQAGVSHVLVPAIHLPSAHRVLEICRRYPGFAFPMIGLHPEEVNDSYSEVLKAMRPLLNDSPCAIAVGEVGLDYYWSREFENLQLAAFEEQVQWSIETRLPLMIHCRKAQNEMVKMLRRYEKDLPGGVFHCFTGNEKEAAELLQFDRFVLGIGGVLTFKKSHLPEVLPTVPINRVVLETDAPYMAPVPMRGKRNESSFVKYVLLRMAECYAVAPEELAAITTQTVRRVFPLLDEALRSD